MFSCQRHSENMHAAWAKHAGDLCCRKVWTENVLENVLRYEEVKRRIIKGQRFDIFVTPPQLRVDASLRNLRIVVGP